MTFLTPFALTFAALSIPILILYMLKLRRRDVLVSSTLLWQQLLRDREANAPWQRLRRNLLLLLQLLILALLTLALARPFVSAPTVVSGNVVILLDASASMQARDVEPTRFVAARRAAREIVAGLGLGDVATIVAVGPRPQVLASATNDRALLRRALEDATPTSGPADWDAAFTLAAAGLTGAADTQVVIISDGALPETLPPLPGEVRFVGVGGEGHNLAITSLATREGPAGPQAFIRIVNYGEAAAQPLVEFFADGLLFDARRLSVPARGSANLTLTDLPYDLQVLQARLAVDDALLLDDTAWAVHAPPVSGRVLLVSRGNLFLERALGALPGVELVRLAPNTPLPTSQEGTEGEYDLYVYDGTITGTLPAGNLWLIGPQSHLPPGEGQGEDGVPIHVGGLFTDTTITHVASDDLLRYVDLSDVHVLQARAVGPPPGARVLIEAEGGPLLFVAERPEGRLAVLTFDLRDSDLPLQIAFPILTANLVDWLLPRGGLTPLAGEGQGWGRPGDSIPIQPAPETAEIIVTAPDGTGHVLPVGEKVPVFAATDQLGVYLVEQFNQSDTALQSDVLAINLFDEAESNIAPREVVRVGQAEVTAATQEEEGRREFWPWLAGAALGILVVEWWVYQRGTMQWGGRKI
ncbi:MAG: VWA domain-containing protein [Chloroflexota bacterium]|nr:VWA domain-containing protein [Chloroflexota bacterium]